MQKQCTRCSNTKSLEEFPKDSRRKDGRYPACNDCKKEIRRQSYIKHAKSIVQKQKEKRAKWREWVNQYKIKCSRCEESHPACLDFHHEGDKEEGIAQMINRGMLKDTTKEKVLEEIKKCVVLCSNCHRKLHWEQRQVGSVV